MAVLFDASKQNISQHSGNYFKESEPRKESAVKDFLTTVADGKRYRASHYNLDIIISIGYRVKSLRGVEF